MNIFGKEIGGGGNSDAKKGQDAVKQKQTERKETGNDLFAAAIDEKDREGVEPRGAAMPQAAQSPDQAINNAEANNPAGITTDPFAPEPQVTTPTPETTSSQTTEQQPHSTTPPTSTESLPGSAMPTTDTAPQPQGDEAPTSQPPTPSPEQATQQDLTPEPAQTDTLTSQDTAQNKLEENNQDSAENPTNIFGLHEESEEAEGAPTEEVEDETQDQTSAEIDQTADADDTETPSEESLTSPEDAYKSLMQGDETTSSSDDKDSGTNPDNEDQQGTEPSVEDLNSKATKEDNPDEAEQIETNTEDDQDEEDQKTTVAAGQESDELESNKEDEKDTAIQEEGHENNNQDVNLEHDSNNTKAEKNDKPENVTDKVKWWAKQNEHCGEHLGKELDNAFVFYLPEGTNDLLVAVGHEYMTQDRDESNRDAFKKISKLLGGEKNSIKSVKVDIDETGNATLIVIGPDNEDSIKLSHLTDENMIFEQLGERTAEALKKHNEEQAQKAETAAKNAEERLIKEKKLPAS